MPVEIFDLLMSRVKASSPCWFALEVMGTESFDQESAVILGFASRKEVEGEDGL